LVPIGSAVRVDRGDRLLLGEVVHTSKDADIFRIGVQVEQYLRQTQDLEALRRALTPTNNKLKTLRMLR
jgi:hypothetical protein